MTQDIDIFKVMDFIRDNAAKLAEAKAKRVYLEHFRKSQKALCMKKAELKGITSGVLQERDAYIDHEYLVTLEGLKDSVEEEEKLRWLMIAAEAKLEVWRSLEASRRSEIKMV